MREVALVVLAIAGLGCAAISAWVAVGARQVQRDTKAWLRERGALGVTMPDEQDNATLIGSRPNPDGSVTYHYEFTPEQASDLGFEVGGFVITGYPEVPGQAKTDHITAYVIRSLPHPARRAQLARAIRADVTYVLRPPMAEVLARARRDGRPAGTATTIRQWYRAYAPSEVDSPCPPEHLVPAPTRAAVVSPASAPSTTP